MISWHLFPPAVLFLHAELLFVVTEEIRSGTSPLPWLSGQLVDVATSFVLLSIRVSYMIIFLTIPQRNVIYLAETTNENMIVPLWRSVASLIMADIHAILAPVASVWYSNYCFIYIYFLSHMNPSCMYCSVTTARKWLKCYRTETEMRQTQICPISPGLPVILEEDLWVCVV